FEVFGIAIVNMESEVVMNPSAVAADGKPQFFVLTNYALANWVVIYVESSFVAKLHGVRASRDVDRVRALFQNSPISHFLKRLDGGIGVHVPVEGDASDAIRNCEQTWKPERVLSKIFQEAVQRQSVSISLQITERKVHE